MKRFYTVKEASDILGFSTNTVYKYLDEGKLKGKRIGRGRFKIPHSEIAPFITSEPQGRTEEEAPVKEVQQSGNNYLTVGLWGVVLLAGIGAVYLLSGNSANQTVGEKTSGPEVKGQTSFWFDIKSAALDYSGRTFSGFGSLISNIFPSMQQPKDQVPEQSEVVSDTPIANDIEEETPSLGVKIDETKSRANELYANAQLLSSRAQRLISKSRTLTAGELNSALVEMFQLLGKLSDNSDKGTVFAEINWLDSNWDFESIDSLKRAGTYVSDTALSLDEKTQSAFAKPEIADVNNLILGTDLLLGFVGNPTDTSSQKTLYGNIKELEILTQDLDAKISEIDKILESWSGLKLSEKEAIVESVVSGGISIKPLAKVDETLLLESTKTGSLELKNKLLTAKAVLNANKAYLAQKTDQPIIVVWSETDAKAYRILVVNPSPKILSQATHKYYLPPEIKRSDINTLDSGLSVNFDSQKSQYYLDINLAIQAGEVKTLGMTLGGESNASLVQEDEASEKPVLSQGDSEGEASVLSSVIEEKKEEQSQNPAPISTEAPVAQISNQTPPNTLPQGNISNDVKTLGLAVGFSAVLALVVLLTIILVRRFKSSGKIFSDTRQAYGESILIPDIDKKALIKEPKGERKPSFLEIKTKEITSSVLRTIPALRGVLIAALIFPINLLKSFFRSLKLFITRVLKIPGLVKTFILNIYGGVKNFLVKTTTSLKERIKAFGEAVDSSARRSVECTKSFVKRTTGFVKGFPGLLRKYLLKLLKSIRTYVLGVSRDFLVTILSTATGVTWSVIQSLMMVQGIIKKTLLEIALAFKRFVLKILSSVKIFVGLTLSSLRALVARIFMSLKKAVRELIRVTTLLFTGLLRALAELGGAVKAAISRALTLMTKIILFYINVFKSAILRVLDAVKNLILAVIGSLIRAVKAFSSALVLLFKNATSLLKQVIVSGIKAVKRIVYAFRTFIYNTAYLFKRITISVIVVLRDLTVKVVTGLLAFILGLISSSIEFVAKIISATIGVVNSVTTAVTKALISMAVLTLRLIAWVAGSLASGMRGLVRLLVSVTRGTESMKTRLDFEPPVIRYSKTRYREAATLILVAFISTLFSVIVSLNVISRFEVVAGDSNQEELSVATSNESY